MNTPTNAERSRLASPGGWEAWPGHSSTISPISARRRNSIIDGNDTIVRVLNRRVQRLRSEFIDCFGQRCRPVGDHLAGLTVITDRAGEQPLRGDGVAALRHVRFDDLAMVIDGAVNVTPHAGHLHIGFVDVPAVGDGISEWIGCVVRIGVKRCTQRKSVT